MNQQSAPLSLGMIVSSYELPASFMLPMNTVLPIYLLIHYLHQTGLGEFFYSVG